MCVDLRHWRLLIVHADGDTMLNFDWNTEVLADWKAAEIRTKARLQGAKATSPARPGSPDENSSDRQHASVVSDLSSHSSPATSPGTPTEVGSPAPGARQLSPASQTRSHTVDRCTSQERSHRQLLYEPEVAAPPVRVPTVPSMVSGAYLADHARVVENPGETDTRVTSTACQRPKTRKKSSSRIQKAARPREPRKRGRPPEVRGDSVLPQTPLAVSDVPALPALIPLPPIQALPVPPAQLAAHQHQFAVPMLRTDSMLPDAPDTSVHYASASYEHWRPSCTVPVAPVAGNVPPVYQMQPIPAQPAFFPPTAMQPVQPPTLYTSFTSSAHEALDPSAVSRAPVSQPFEPSLPPPVPQHGMYFDQLSGSQHQVTTTPNFSYPSPGPLGPTNCYHQPEAEVSYGVASQVDAKPQQLYQDSLVGPFYDPALGEPQPDFDPWL